MNNIYSEKNILDKINNLSANFIIALYETRLLLNDIKKDIKKTNNNYFDKNPEIMNRLNNILNDNALKELSFLLTDYKTYIQYKESICCNHIWIHDLIDIDPDRSQHIIYCELCEVIQR